MAAYTAIVARYTALHCVVPCVHSDGAYRFLSHRALLISPPRSPLRVTRLSAASDLLRPSRRQKSVDIMKEETDKFDPCKYSAGRQTTLKFERNCKSCMGNESEMSNLIFELEIRLLTSYLQRSKLSFHAVSGTHRCSQKQAAVRQPWKAVLAAT